MPNNNEIAEEPVVAENDVIDAATDATVAAEGEPVVSEVDALKAEISALKDALAEAEQKATVNYDLALRTKAEAENSRRRQEKDLSNARKFGVEKFAKELLPIIDSMEMGLGVATDDADVGKFREGSEMAIKMFVSALEKIGATVIDPQGEKFDPDNHQAMSMVENADLAQNTVMNVVQKGYLLHGRLMRPAMVIVSKGGPAATPSGGSIDEIV